MNETVLIERMGFGSAAISHLADGKTVFVQGGAPGDTVTIEILRQKKSFAEARILRVEESGAARTMPSDIPCPIARLRAEAGIDGPNANAAHAAGGSAYAVSNAGKAKPSSAAPTALCGGCPWSHLAYDAQLAAKRTNVVEALVRTGRVERGRAESITGPCIGSKRQWGYRNKLELACGTDGAGRLALGLHGAEDAGFASISACPLGNRLIEKLPKALQGALRFACGSGGADSLGLYRVGIRGSLRTRDVEVALWTRPGAFPRNEVSRVLKSAVRATSIVRVLADPGKERKVKGVESLAGKGVWEEELLWDAAQGSAADAAHGGTPAAPGAPGKTGTSSAAHANGATQADAHGKGADAPEAGPSARSARFLTSAPSFFQVNTAQAGQLVSSAIAALEDGGFPLQDALVADLYAGGGTFSIPLAEAGAQVVAIEAAGSSVRDLRRNAAMNRADIEVIGGDAGRELADLLEDVDGFDALLVDPPRAGLSPEAHRTILDAKPQRIAYVSCDPQTLARDIARFEEAGYLLQSAQPVDLFPQTFHVETVALLARKPRG